MREKRLSGAANVSAPVPAYLEAYNLCTRMMAIAEESPVACRVYIDSEGEVDKA